MTAMSASLSKPSFRAATLGDPPLRRPFGFNVIGHISGNVGLGITARSVVRLILQKGYPVATFDIDPGRGRAGHDVTYAHLAAPTIEELPYCINLLVLSITALPDIILERRIKLRDDVVNAGYFWWELPVIPEMWVKSLELFDVLVAGSQYLRGTFERVVDGTAIVYAQHAMEDFGAIQSDRSKFGIPTDKVVFVCIVEPTSDPARKNPLGAIKAFQNAFSSDDSAHLVIKVNNALVSRASSGMLAQLRADAAGLGDRVTLIDGTLEYGEVLQLYASCDVFVGLHRAEGLGLGLMEAMALGKPVISTAWSGNMTFMNRTNSCLVGFHLVPVDGSLRVYSRAFLGDGARWAEPKLDEAVAWMRALARDARLRQSIGRKAAEDMQRFRVEGDRGMFLDELRAIWEQQQFLPHSTAGRMDASLKTLRKARIDHDTGPIERTRRKATALVERHLLWRFRSK
jgi:glycosyltransferase involved in cell wall biosynthesis